MKVCKITHEIQSRLLLRGIEIEFGEVNTLRRAERTLHRWAELECGDGVGYIHRDEDTGIPYYTNCNSSYASANDPRATWRTADRETGAKRRIEAIAKAHGLHVYYQTDPRGCALYVSTKPLTDRDYTNGVTICA